MCVDLRASLCARFGCAGGSLVSDVHVDSLSGRVTAVTTRDREGAETRHEADAVVFAIGIGGALRAYPVLAWIRVVTMRDGSIEGGGTCLVLVCLLGYCGHLVPGVAAHGALHSPAASLLLVSSEHLIIGP